MNQQSQRNIVYLGLVSCFTDFASSMVKPIIPLFLVVVLVEGVDKVGLVLGITTVVSYLLRFLAGSISDRFDYNKPLLILGYSLSAISKPLMAFTGSWQSVATLSSLERFGKALRAAPKDKLISLSSPSGKEGKMLGLHKSFDLFGEFGGLVLVFFILFYVGSGKEVLTNIFLASAAPGILAVASLVILVKDIKSSTSSAKKSKLSLKMEPKLATIIIMFCGFSFFSFNEAFLVLTANELDLEFSSIILLLIVTRVFQLAISYRTGLAVDKWGANKVMILGFLAAPLATALLLSSSMTILTAAFILFGLSEVILINAVRSYISKHAINKGSSFGAFYFLYAITTALGLAAIGFIWEQYSQFAAILFSVTGTVVIALVFALMYWKPSTESLPPSSIQSQGIK